MTKRWGLLVGVSLVLGAAAVFADSGTAVIQSTGEGAAVIGTATLTDSPAGLAVSIRVSGVSPGKHGLHVHEFGACGDQGKAAGSHYNPDGVPHGFAPNDGVMKAHPGDLGNLEVDANGAGSLALILSDVALSGGKYAVGGRAIVLHEKTDDFGQPTGNAGGRIGCGLIVITGK